MVVDDLNWFVKIFSQLLAVIGWWDDFLNCSIPGVEAVDCELKWMLNCNHSGNEVYFVFVRNAEART